MDLSKISGFFSGFLDGIKGFFSRFSFSFFSHLWQSFYGFINTIPIVERVPEEKRRPFLIALGGLFFLFIVLIFAVLLNLGKHNKDTPLASAAALAIQEEEFFIPAEPDLIPEFLFEKESGHSWLLDDIRPYWRKPEISEHWRDEIKSVVDKLMEGVP